METEPSIDVCISFLNLLGSALSVDTNQEDTHKEYIITFKKVAVYVLPQNPQAVFDVLLKGSTSQSLDPVSLCGKMINRDQDLWWAVLELPIGSIVSRDYLLQLVDTLSNYFWAHREAAEVIF